MSVLFCVVKEIHVRVIPMVSLISTEHQRLFLVYHFVKQLIHGRWDV